MVVTSLNDLDSRMLWMPMRALAANLGTYA